MALLDVPDLRRQTRQIGTFLYIIIFKEEYSNDKYSFSPINKQLAD